MRISDWSSDVCSSDLLYVAGELTFNLARKLASEARAGARTLSEREGDIVQFTQSCHRVLTAMLRREPGRQGWLTPDYETIMSWTGLSRSTVHRSLNVLQAPGPTGRPSLWERGGKYV